MSKTTKKVQTKKCTKCGLSKSIDQFYVFSGKIRADCKLCNNSKSRNYKAKNKKHISNYNHIYKKENCTEISVYNHNYNLANRTAIQQRQTKTHKIRRENDPNFKKTHELRSLLYSFVKKGTPLKLKNIVGCSYNSLMLWFTYLFDEAMTKENHGSYWSIDHVDPCCNFDLTLLENQIVCFNWSNLRPIKTLENQSKTGKTIQKEIRSQKKLASDFLSILPEEEKALYVIL